MSTQNSIINIAELAAAMPNAILQISAGDLCDFANRLIESATDVARLQIERANLSKELLTIEEVADMLKVSKMTLYRWNLNDTLPKIEIGGKRRYRRADVEAIVEQRKDKKQRTRKQQLSPKGLCRSTSSAPNFPSTDFRLRYRTTSTQCATSTIVRVSL